MTAYLPSSHFSKRLSSSTCLTFANFFTCSLMLRVAVASGLLAHTQPRQIRETSCQLNSLLLTPETSMIGQQRRRNATIVLRTDISHGQGLTNQHINLVSLITLALAGDVDNVILPKHRHRTHFSLAASWQDAPTEELWDFHSIRELLLDRGVGIQALPIDGFEEMVLNCKWYHKSLDIADVVHIMKQNIKWHLASAEHLTHYKVILTIPNFDFGLHSSNSQLFREVMLAVRFSSKIQDTASLILQEIWKKDHAFNGLHLRMEDDMAGYVDWEGGFLVAKEQYEKAFRKLHYDNTSLLYVASGLFVDSAKGETSVLMNQAFDWLTHGIGKVYAVEYFSKETVLPHAKLQDLSSEQRAAVDVMVLKHSVAFVGLSISTMSYLVQEMRTVSGHPKETNVLVGNPANEKLFQNTLTLVSGSV